MKMTELVGNARQGARHGVANAALPITDHSGDGEVQLAAETGCLRKSTAPSRFPSRLRDCAPPAPLPSSSHAAPRAPRVPHPAAIHPAPASPASGPSVAPPSAVYPPSAAPAALHSDRADQ